MEKITIYIIANAAMGTGMSGSDRIFIECARRWAKNNVNVNVIVWEEGYNLCRRNNLDNVNYIVWTAEKYKKYGLILFYLIRTIKGCLYAFKIKTEAKSRVVIYSASDFWMDSLPAWILRIRNKGANWIAGFYLFIPPPWNKDFPYKGKKFITGLLYWISQKPIYFLIKRYTDMVFVTNEPYINSFITARRSKDRIIAIRGGIDVSEIDAIPEPEKKIYDAVFLGRFHPQKGVLEMIDIWNIVCKRIHNAKLAIIGEGDLEWLMKKKANDYGIINNIEFFGFKDGIEKNRIFKNSKVALYPATLDHWSMAPVEAMVCGLPLVTFDMPVNRSVKLKGAVCAPCFELNKFAEGIISLLIDVNLYNLKKKEALEWAKGWDWNSRADDILKIIKTL